MRRLFRLEVNVAMAVFAITACLICYKVYGLGYSMTTIKPEDGYFIRLIMTVNGNGRDCTVRTTLPIESQRQTRKYERESSEEVFEYNVSLNRTARRRARNLEGEHAITYSFFAKTQEEYELQITSPFPLPGHLEAYVGATDRIQADAPEIIEKAYELAPEGADVVSAVRAAYNYCYSDVDYRTVRGPTDALTALQLEEAWCNGKSRLMDLLALYLSFQTRKLR